MTEDGTKARGVIGVVLALALLIIILSLIFFAPRPEVKDYLTLLIGALIANVTAIIQFYFGSSSGAKQLVATQSALLANQAGSPLGDSPKGTADDPVSVKEVPEDPNLTKYRQMAKLANPSATDDQIAASWAALKGVDIPT